MLRSKGECGYPSQILRFFLVLVWILNCFHDTVSKKMFLPCKFLIRLQRNLILFSKAIHMLLRYKIKLPSPNPTNYLVIHQQYNYKEKTFIGSSFFSGGRYNYHWPTIIPTILHMQMQCTSKHT